MKKSILFISHSAELNGAELMLLHTMQGMNRDKFHPVLTVPREGPLVEETRKSGIPTELVPAKWYLTSGKQVWKQPLSWLANIPAVRKTVEIAEKNHSSLIFSNSAAVFTGAVAARGKNLPHIWAVHELLRGRTSLLKYLFGSKRLIRYILRHSNAVIVNSHATGQAFGETEKVRLVYNGIDIPEEVRSSPDIFKEFNFKDGGPILAVVGKIYKEKGQKEILLALKHLKERYPKIRLLIIGESKNRRYTSLLKKIIRRNDLEEHVTFTGYRKDAVDLIRAADLLIIASKIDSFGRTAVEAMSVRTPVLSVRTKGIEEIIENGISGFLVENTLPETISNAVTDIFRERRGLEAVKKTANAVICRRFLLNDQIRRIEDIIEECLEKK